MPSLNKLTPYPTSNPGIWEVFYCFRQRKLNAASRRHPVPDATKPRQEPVSKTQL